ncbi:PEP-CTERM sorting domain-containing protein [Microcoleus sp.]|uniref:PEP-CTERM sorting domain-containing protein n=1 Tax=Microcoleus sp. TaxID=44472 RepID=UPI00403EBA42
MSYKLRPRLGSAIATTILSLFSGVLLVGVDKTQAANLTYNFLDSKSFFKVNNSSVTGIGKEYIPVSEGRVYSFTLGSLFEGSKEYYDLAGKIAFFYQGDFVGLQASGSDYGTKEFIIPPEQGGPLNIRLNGGELWNIYSLPTSFTTWKSVLDGYSERYTSVNGGNFQLADRRIYRERPVSYTLVNTEAEPVPEPLTAGGTALALAGLSWLKHKKKMAA